MTAIVEDRSLNAGEGVALLVNNLGGTTIMELNIVARSALQALADRNIVVQRAFVGTFLSALEMAGCSISLMRLNERRLRQLDREVDAPAWPRTRVPDRPLSLNKVRLHPEEIGSHIAKSRPRPVISSAAGKRLSEAIQLAAQALNRCGISFD